MGAVTEWFPAPMKPVHIGVYEVAEEGFPSAFSFWNGKRFMYRIFPKFEDSREASIELASRSRHAVTVRSQNVHWRGLAVKP